MSHGRLQHILFKARLSIDKKSIYLFQFFLPDIFAQPFLFFSFFFFSFCGFVNISQQLFSSPSSSSSLHRIAIYLTYLVSQKLATYASPFPFLSFPCFLIPHLRGGTKYIQSATHGGLCMPTYVWSTSKVPTVLPTVPSADSTCTYIPSLGAYIRYFGYVLQID